ncbi:MAG: hypothetical protein L0I24_08355 [Pseudonocardia sp.]|nr:hypothetical protein [Pseudonocardia sp.]
MELFGLFAVLLLLYVGIGNFIANRYFRRRHGVRGRLGRGLASFDSGWVGSLAVSMTWPVAVFSPAVRDPELCTHQHHVLARDGDRRRAQEAQEALRREGRV